MVAADVAMRAQDGVAAAIWSIGGRKPAILGAAFSWPSASTRRAVSAALKAIPVPPRYADLFTEIPEYRFRVDISSSEIRARRRIGAIHSEPTDNLRLCCGRYTQITL
jgi:hypothetical protein